MLKIRNYEWQILKINLIRSGVSSLDAEKIIQEHRDIMDTWYDKLKQKVKTKKLTAEQADKQFKQKFWTMAQKWEN